MKDYKKQERKVQYSEQECKSKTKWNKKNFPANVNEYKNEHNNIYM